MSATCGSQLPLDTLANTVSVLLDKAEKAQTKSDDFRIAAGKHLIEARERVKSGEAGDIGWEAWCSINLRRSLGDIRKCLALAGSPDPEEAQKKAREKNRLNNANYYARKRAGALQR
jgi:hypothetical protein